MYIHDLLEHYKLLLMRSVSELEEYQQKLLCMEQQMSDVWDGPAAEALRNKFVECEKFRKKTEEELSQAVNQINQMVFKLEYMEEEGL